MDRYMALSDGLAAGLVAEYEAAKPDLNEIMTESTRSRFDVLTRDATIFTMACIGDDDYIFLATDPDGVIQQIDIGGDIEEGIYGHAIYDGDTKGLITDLSAATEATSDVQKVMELLAGAHTVSTKETQERQNALDAEIAVREALDVLKTMQSIIKKGNVRSEIAIELTFLQEIYDGRPT